MIEFTYNGNVDKVISVISSKYPHIGYNQLQKILRKGDVKVNGRKQKDDVLLKYGDVVRIYGADDFKPKAVYENDVIVVFLKPAKMPTTGENSLEEKVKNDFPEYRVCHRLDTNTEGLVIFAKNDLVFEEIKAAFKRHEIKKYYIAVVVGKVPDKAELVGYLVKDSEKGQVKIYDEYRKGAEKIITKITPICKGKEYTTLEIELVTGRTHQIRAHLNHIGHPIIGDPKYGKNDVNRRYGKKYQMLLAYKLVFGTKNGLLAELNGLEVSVPPDEKFFNLT